MTILLFGRRGEVFERVAGACFLLDRFVLAVDGDFFFLKIEPRLQRRFGFEVDLALVVARGERLCCFCFRNMSAERARGSHLEREMARSYSACEP